MIVDWFMDLSVTIVEWIAGLFPEAVIPEWFTSMGLMLSGLLGGLSGMGVWVNWVVVGGCVTSVLASWLFFSNVKLVRVAAGHVPQFGGNG